MKNIHLELKTQYRALFESQLAAQLMTHSDALLPVKMISTNALNYMEQNKEKIIDMITKREDDGKESKIILELREPYFGHIYSENEVVTPEQVYDDFVRLLQNPNTDLSIVMQLHCIFSYRLFEKNEQFEQLKKTLKPTKSMGRSRTNPTPEPVHHMGFVKNPVWEQRMIKMMEVKPHRRAVDQYKLNTESELARSISEKCIPTVADYSGHTASLLAGAIVYGHLDPHQLNEYAWACFAFLAAGGNHSFHEVMSIAALAEINYQMGNYVSLMPSSIKTMGFFSEMKKQFPEYLESEYANAI